MRWSAVGAVLHRLPAVSRYSELPEFNKEEGLSFSSSTLAIGVLVWKCCSPLPLYYGATVIVCSRSSFALHCWRKCQQCSISSRSPLTIALFARYDGVASLSKSYSGGAQPVRVNHYLNAHHAEFRVSLFSLALMLAVPFAPQALRKRQPLPPRHNRKLPPVADDC